MKKICLLILYMMFGFSLTQAQRLHPDNATAQQVVDKFIKVSGGNFKLKKYRHITTKVKITINETIKCKGMVYQKLPSKFSLYFIHNEIVFHREIFDGKKAVIMNSLDTTFLTGADLESFKSQALINPETHYRKLKYELNKLDMEQIYEKTAFQIEAISPLGDTVINFYDAKNGLKIRTVQTVKVGNKRVQQVTDIGKYRIVSGVKYPLSKVITTGDLVMRLQIVGINNRARIKRDVFKIKIAKPVAIKHPKRKWYFLYLK